MRSAVPADSRRSEHARIRSIGLVDVIVFISIVGLNFGTYFGLAAAIFYFMPMVLVFRQSILKFRASDLIVIMALPVYCLASWIWSDIPGNTLKIGVEVVLSVVCALVIVANVDRNQFIYIFFYAQLFCVIVSLALGNRAVIFETGEYALIGIYGSKNNFAMAGLLLLCSSATLWLSRRRQQPLNIQLLGILVSGYTIFGTVSAGAIVTLGCIAIVFTMYICLRRFSQMANLFILYMVLLLTIAGVMLTAVTDIVPILFSMLGKSTTLTGRTDLWQIAEYYIAQKPYFGVGYQAFWVRGNGPAEQLWEQFFITGQKGFHFHNLFYETSVQLGYIGAFLMFTSLAYGTIPAAINLFRNRTPADLFYFSVFLIFLSRVYSELDFLAPFARGTTLLPIVIIYSISRRQGRSTDTEALSRGPRGSTASSGRSYGRPGHFR